MTITKVLRNQRKLVTLYLTQQALQRRFFLKTVIQEILKLTLLFIVNIPEAPLKTRPLKK